MDSGMFDDLGATIMLCIVIVLGIGIIVGAVGAILFSHIQFHIGWR